MNAPETFFLPDVQSAADLRRLAIQNVGVKGLRYPLQLISAPGRGDVSTVANLTMTVGLPPEVKGTHMSRFVELLEAERGALTQEGLFAMLQEMLLRLDASSGRLEMSFPYFIRKAAPVSGVTSLLDYDVTLIIDQPVGQAAVDPARRLPPSPACARAPRRFPITAPTTSARTSRLKPACARRWPLRSWCAWPRRRRPAKSSACSSARMKSG
jgi:GTP cyclohydrolase I